MAIDKIIIKGAREHNLKNVNLEIPRDKLIVFTGVSGSGKSSLAFDTIYADGQRRYMESLSSYARMFLGQMEKPNVDSIEGLSPAISIDQKTTNKNPRSTVGTVTEIYDYLRILYARIGVPHCPICGREISHQTVDQMVDRILKLPEGAKMQIYAPIIRARKGTHQKELEAARKSGFVRARIDGSLYELSEDIVLDKNKKHNIEVMIDRLVMSADIRSRLSDSLETALKLSDGLILVDVIDEEEIMFSQNYSCPEHDDISIGELSPRMFSFNSPDGACEKCTGLGNFLKVDEELVIPNRNISIREGAIRAPGFYYGKADMGTIAQMYYNGLAEHYGFSLDDKIKDIPLKTLNKILYGTGKDKIKITRVSEYGEGTYNAPFEGIINNLERRFAQTRSSWSKDELSSFMSSVTCPDCHGEKLKPVFLAVTIGGANISKVTTLSVGEAADFLRSLDISERDQFISETILTEINERLNFLKSVGLDYLTLSRNAATLSGGESQRIRLATQIGSSLMGVLYILDEPSIGLHQRDNDRLIATLQRLRDLGNTVIVVEHDDDTIRAADYIVDIGPGAGVHGGEIVATGSLEDIMKNKNSITGQYLSGKMAIPIPKKRRKANGHVLSIKGASENNLKNVDVDIPLGILTCVTGVSGSGKSSLINEVLYKHLARELNRAKSRGGKCKEIVGLENLDKVIAINQNPIGRTPRSNPATYTGVFTDIRNVFSQTNDSKMRGFAPGRFSFNVKGGRCEACEGDGIVKIEMHFLPDIYVPCEVCSGSRYNRETLDVKFRDKNIHEVLEMTVEEGAKFFENHPRISRKLDTLLEVGLGYIKIGQSSTTLSGGEAQRVKLATELSKRATGKTIYILDEPTTGLHTADVHKLVEVLGRLVDTGNTAVVIEHNLDIIKTADYVIDLGPEGGKNGGEVIATGTPEQIAKKKGSYTGIYLKKALQS